MASQRLKEPLPEKKLFVYSMKETPNGTSFVKAGVAWLQTDGSIKVHLDILPLEGKLHISEDEKVKAKED